MIENKEGQKIPSVTFKTREDDEWVDITSEEIFSKTKVVVFSLPGAYTPTCSSAHVPRYNELANVIKKYGVDDIVCISVNDAFVMNAWKEDQKADKITFLPDGNGEFTEKMGMLVDKSDLGFGKRSWRYSMLVEDMVIKKMFIEPQKPGDPYEVSDADTMLWYLDPDAKAPEYITLFTQKGCSHCAEAKRLLRDMGLDFEEIPIEGKVTGRSLRAVTGKKSTPQIYIGGKYIGGLEQLRIYMKENKM